MSRRTRGIVLVGILVSLLLAGVGSYYASSSPDGLARVAIDTGMDKGERAHATSDSPLAGYSVSGVREPWLSGGLAGVAGVALTFVIGGALVFGVRRRGAGSRQDANPAERTPGGGGAPS